MGSTFYRGCETWILVFDLTSRDSFNNLGDWKKEFLNSLNPPDADTYPFILFGNKRTANFASDMFTNTKTDDVLNALEYKQDLNQFNLDNINADIL